MEKCQIKESWCGKNKIPKRNLDNLVYYAKRGTPYECLRKGIGAGKSMSEKIPEGSLRMIKYVGEKTEEKFKRQKITNLKDLYRVCEKKDFSKTLKKVCTNKLGNVDRKSFNSVIWHLKKMGYQIFVECVEE